MGDSALVQTFLVHIEDGSRMLNDSRTVKGDCILQLNI